MKRFMYHLSSGKNWVIVDHVNSKTICSVDDADHASIICNALNAKYPPREDKL